MDDNFINKYIENIEIKEIDYNIYKYHISNFYSKLILQTIIEQILDVQEELKLFMILIIVIMIMLK
mgnify:CR=1 FL=1